MIRRHRSACGPTCAEPDGRSLEARSPNFLGSICQQCNAFFSLVTGGSSAAETARHLLVARPLSVDVTRKHVIGLERDGALIAIVDLLEGYPDRDDWYVGLLLLSPGERGRGLGAAVWAAVEQWICAEGGRHARLIVQEQNPAAVRFWRAAGFTADGTVEQRLPARTNLCWRFEKPLIAVPREQVSIDCGKPAL